jgi:hypothetical protein
LLVKLEAGHESANVNPPEEPHGQREESESNQHRQLRKKLLNKIKVICIKMVSRTF